MKSQGSSLFDSWNNFSLYGAGSAAPKRGPQVHPRHFHLEDVSTKGQGCNHTLLASSCDCEDFYGCHQDAVETPAAVGTASEVTRRKGGPRMPTQHFLEPRLEAELFSFTDNHDISWLDLYTVDPILFWGCQAPTPLSMAEPKVWAGCENMWKSCKKMSCNWGCMLKA